MELENSEKQLTEKEFESFESTLSVSFPKDFVRFYLTFNRGSIHRRWILSESAKSTTMELIESVLEIN